MAQLINDLGGPAGFGENEGPFGDDDTTGPIDLTPVFADGITFFGQTYDAIYVNSNGNLTFEQPLFQFSPQDLSTLDIAGLFPFWSDVRVGAGDFFSDFGYFDEFDEFDYDLESENAERFLDRVTPGGTSQGTNAIWYDLDPEGGTFTVTWDDVTPFDLQGEARNAFQIRLIDLTREEGRLPGDFRVELRYEAIEWTAGFDSFDVADARIGFTIGDGEAFFQLDASAEDAALLALPDRGVLSFTFDAFGLRDFAAEPAILGTSGDDLLLGTDGDDAIQAGTGQDTIRPGLGADEIILAGGGKLIAGTADELLGDSLRGALWDDALFFDGEAFGADAISVSDDGFDVLFDIDGDGEADGAIASDVAVSGGAFLTAEAAGGTFVGYVRDLPDLAPGAPVTNPGRLAGDGLTDAYLSGDGASAFRLTLNAVSAPAPGTALGVYEIDTEGALVDARLVSTDIAADIAAVPGASFVFDGVEAQHQVGLFLLKTDDPEPLERAEIDLVNQLGEAASLDDRNFVFAAQDGAVIAGDLIHAHDPILNQDLQRHVLVARDAEAPGLTVAFEDMPFFEQGDFADVVLSVERIAAEVI